MPWQVLIENVAAVSLIISVWMHLHYKLYRLSNVQANLGFGLTSPKAAQSIYANKLKPVLHGRPIFVGFGVAT